MNTGLAVMNHYSPTVSMNRNMKDNRRLFYRRGDCGGSDGRIACRSLSNNRLAPISIKEVTTITSLSATATATATATTPITTVAAAATAATAIIIDETLFRPPTQKINTTNNIVIPLDVDDDDDDDDGYNFDDSELISIIKTVVNEHHQEDEEVLALAATNKDEDNNNNNIVSLSSSKKRQRRIVRFALPEEATVSVSEEGEVSKKKNRGGGTMFQNKINKKVKLTHGNDTNDDNDDGIDNSISWYTSRELKNIHNSIIFAVKRYELSCSGIGIGSGNVNQDVQDDSLLDQSLEKFLLCNRKKYRILRNRMTETCYAVRQFELCSNTNQSIMLSQLLQRLRSTSQSIISNNKTTTSIISSQVSKFKSKSIPIL
jgi:hypothetical protein